MISIITTAINRPALLKRTMDSLIANSNILKHDIKWVVHVDFVAHLGRDEYQRTVELCNSYKKQMPVSVIARDKPEGPARAILDCAPHIKGETIFYLEDDWLCHPHGDPKNKDFLDVGYYLERLKKYAYCTAAARLERCSFNPCFMRRWHYEHVTKDLEIFCDAEMQAQRRWQKQETLVKNEWLFDPEPKKYFTDIGREWLAKTPLKKWDMKTRYTTPLGYAVEDKK